RTGIWRVRRARLQWSRRLSSAEGLSCDSPRASRSRLQWSRRLSSAEGSSTESRPTSSRAASMEPPTFIGGRVLWLSCCRPERLGFNGAADFHRRKENPPNLPQFREAEKHFASAPAARAPSRPRGPKIG